MMTILKNKVLELVRRSRMLLSGLFSGSSPLRRQYRAWCLPLKCLVVSGDKGRSYEELSSTGSGNCLNRAALEWRGRGKGDLLLLAMVDVSRMIRQRALAPTSRSSIQVCRVSSVVQEADIHPLKIATGSTLVIASVAWPLPQRQQRPGCGQRLSDRFQGGEAR